MEQEELNKIEKLEEIKIRKIMDSYQSENISLNCGCCSCNTYDEQDVKLMLKEAINNK